MTTGGRCPATGMERGGTEGAEGLRSWIHFRAMYWASSLVGGGKSDSRTASVYLPHSPRRLVHGNSVSPLASPDIVFSSFSIFHLLWTSICNARSLRCSMLCCYAHRRPLSCRKQGNTGACETSMGSASARSFTCR